MKKTDKNAWFEEGMKVLKNEGFQRITIDNLCSLLQITKGSFYHYFKNIDGYIDALMKYWQDKNTVDFIKNTEAIVDINEKYIQLHKHAASASQKAEQMIRAWGFSNATVLKHLQQVDEMRLEYLVKLNMQRGYDEKEAKYRATLEYGTLVGIQQLNPDISEKEFDDLYLLFTNQISKSQR